jgi:hypothetical protein
MNISHAHDDRFLLDCDRHDLVILANAINNLGQDVDERDHDTLMGATQAEVQAVHRALLAALGTSGIV